MDYDDRITLVFNMFDTSRDGQLDRKETSKMIQCTIYGMIKICQLPIPSKKKVISFIDHMFSVIDDDSSGVVDFEELKYFVDHNMEIQNFMLRYSRVQTYVRAQTVFEHQIERWNEFFRNIAIDYFGSLFVETNKLSKALY